MKCSAPHIIHHVENKKIDKRKWDTCIAASDNPLIYARSAYLDAMCPHWDALILNDYEAVMPLPWNRKYGISYVYSPFYVIGGGVFGKNLTPQLVNDFISAIPKRFLYIDLDLNEANLFPAALAEENIRHKIRRNTLLPLYAEYGNIRKNYSSLAKRKIKRADKQNLIMKDESDVQKTVDLYQRLYKGKDPVIEQFDFRNMVSFLQNDFSHHTKTLFVSFADGEPAAFYLLLYDDAYVYWLLGGSTERGKEAGAFYYLTDKVIQEFAGTRRVLRFEGSDHEGIHFFNRQFGGKEVHYPRLVLNRLPRPIRWLK